MTEPKSKITVPARNWIPAIMYFSILVTLLIINFKMISPYILAILTGGVLTLFLLPAYQKLRNLRIRPFLASGIVTLGITLAIIVPLTFFTVAATNQANSIVKKISEDSNVSTDTIIEKISNWKIIQTLVGDKDELKKQLTEMIRGGAERFTNVLLKLAATLPDRLFLLGITLLSCFFFLVDGHRFLQFINEKIQLDSDVRNQLQHSFKNTAISIIWATVTAATAQALIILLAFLSLGIPAAFLSSGAAFIFAWIPFVGSLPVWVTGVVYLLLQDRQASMIAMFIIGIFTSSIDNYIRPWILKGRNELHPMVSLISIFGGIKTFGILGVFFGPIFAASLITLLQIWPTVGKRMGLSLSTKLKSDKSSITDE